MKLNGFDLLKFG